MKSASVTVSSRGYIVLPAKIRKEMEIITGTKVLITKEKDRLIWASHKSTGFQCFI